MLRRGVLPRLIMPSTVTHPRAAAILLLHNSQKSSEVHVYIRILTRQKRLLYLDLTLIRCTTLETGKQGENCMHFENGQT